MEQILAHFAETARFTSPRAALIVGTPVIDGKPALRAYWTAAVPRLEDTRFTLDRVLWSAPARELVIVYVRIGGGKTTRACELLRFGADGLVVEGEAMYGATT